jgi:phosphoethanolamine N-methyltransferase
MGHHTSDREVEYDDSMIAMLELIWGEGFMAPGGTGLVDRLVEGIDLEGKHVLDIGSGLGGPDCYLARHYRARVTGIDIEAKLVELANDRARRMRLEDQVRFLLVEPGPLPLPDDSLDVIISAGAITQIPEKAALFAECRRVLKPGGLIRSFEWTTSCLETSDDLRRFFELEGLTYALEVPDEYKRLLRESGFTGIRVSDDSAWYRRQSREEYELIRGPLYPRMRELLGQADADHFVESWEAMATVFRKGELTQTTFFCINPA